MPMRVYPYLSKDEQSPFHSSFLVMELADYKKDYLFLENKLQEKWEIRKITRQTYVLFLFFLTSHIIFCKTIAKRR